MQVAKLEAVEYKSFEQIKQTDENGNEFWYARDLSSVLDYSKWENFSKVIKRAMLACKNSGYNIDEQFPEVRKLFEVGHGAKRTNHLFIQKMVEFIFTFDKKEQNG
jgi:DNA-damage-inducible protein D